MNSTSSKIIDEEDMANTKNSSNDISINFENIAKINILGDIPNTRPCVPAPEIIQNPIINNTPVNSRPKTPPILPQKNNKSTLATKKTNNNSNNTSNNQGGPDYHKIDEMFQNFYKSFKEGNLKNLSNNTTDQEDIKKVIKPFKQVYSFLSINKSKHFIVDQRQKSSMNGNKNNSISKPIFNYFTEEKSQENQIQEEKMNQKEIIQQNGTSNISFSVLPTKEKKTKKYLGEKTKRVSKKNQNASMIVTKNSKEIIENNINNSNNIKSFQTDHIQISNTNNIKSFQTDYMHINNSINCPSFPLNPIQGQEMLIQPSIKSVAMSDTTKKIIKIPKDDEDIQDIGNINTQNSSNNSGIDNYNHKV